jgi:hypothetical protein
MNDIVDLLAIPREWEKRPEAWQRLTHGYVLFDALRECVQYDDLDQVIPLASQWQVFAANSRDQSRRSWQILWTLFTCAKIAALKADTAHNFPTILHELDPQAPIPDELECQEALPDAQTWRRFLHDTLYRLTWHAPLSAEWAWDAVTTLMGNPRTIVRSANISILLIATGGITSRLTLERFSDEGRGMLYNDPRTMSFLNWGEQFEQAMQSAVACTRGEGLWSKPESVDVRWKLTRDDSKQLTYVDGASAGGVFALGLAKLFAEA